MTSPTQEAQHHFSATAASTPQRCGALLSRLLAPFARRFIAGTSLAQALDAAGRLKAQGFLTTIDHLGEMVRSRREATIAADQYAIILRALAERGLDRNVSIKPTQMGLAIDPELCRENLGRIVAAAEKARGFVRIDMEGSDETEGTLDLVSRLKRTRASPVGVALQAMLKRTPSDLVELLRREVSVRLCKGAYKEPPEIAHQEMEEIRRQFAAMAKRLLTSGIHHAIATHDEGLIRGITAFARKQGIAPDQFEFQMLLGIRPRLQKRIVQEGWHLRIYIPFGRAWLPYVWRRLRERKENAWFVVKHLFVR